MAYDLELIKQDIDKFLYSNQEVVIETNDDYLKAGDLLKIVKNKIFRIEEQRKDWTRPMDLSKKRIMDDVKQVIKPLNDFIEMIDPIMIKWWKKEKKIKDAEQAKIEEAALAKIKKEGKSNMEVSVVNDIKTQRGDIATTTITQHWTHKIIDESKIPREYLSVDEVKIRIAIRNKVRKIEGVKIFQTERVNSR